jgi:hypothetical protein
MAGIVGGPGVFFRVLIAGITSMLIMTTMTMAFRIFTGAATEGVDFTGGFLGASPIDGYLFYNLAVILVGAITFLGSFYVLSKE